MIKNIRLTPDEVNLQYPDSGTLETAVPFTIPCLPPADRASGRGQQRRKAHETGDKVREQYHERAFCIRCAGAGKTWTESGIVSVPPRASACLFLVCNGMTPLESLSADARRR
eukprot:gene8666-biopygen18142